MSRFSLALGLSLLMAGVVPLRLGALAGQEKRENPKPTAPPKAQGATKSQPVLVTKCSIKLIDEVTLGSGRTGILALVPKEGSFVKKDKVVARIKDEVAQANFNTAEKEASNTVEIRYAEKNSEVAKAEHEISLDANRRTAKTIPDIEVQKQKLAYERAVLQIEQAEHQLAVAKLKKNEAWETLKLYKIEAPFDGVVTRVYKFQGEPVREGDPILEISSTARVKVEGYVNIKDVWSIKTGSPVKVQLDIDDVDLEEEKQIFAGRIVFVDVKSQAVTQETRVWAEVDNPNNVLRSGLTAKMTIYPNQAAAQTALQGK